MKTPTRRTGQACMVKAEWRGWVVAVVVSAGLAVVASAQPAANASDSGASTAGTTTPVVNSKESRDAAFTMLVGQLNSTSAPEREHALEVLSSDSAYDLKMIEDTLKTETLSAEQRYRLMEAARERFMGSPRAAMGVQFSRLPLPERVVLEKTYPQFPSFKTLKEGDMILSVEGEKLRSRNAWNRLGAHIVSKDPGQKLSMVIRRGEEKLDVEVELGSYRDLPGPTSMDLTKLERAWELRSGAYSPKSAAAPIATGIPVGKWDVGMESAADQKRMRVKMQLPNLYRPRLIAGGEPRGGEIDDLEQTELWNAFNNGRINAIDRRALMQLAQAGGGMQPDLGSMVTMTIQQEIAGLEQTREQVKAAMQREGVAGNKPRNQGLADWELGNIDRVKMLSLIDLSITALKAEAAEMTTPDTPTGTGPLQP